jgi:hypothetical protein
VRRQPQQRHDAALAVVVRAHHKQHVLGRDDDHEGPEHQRDQAEHDLGAGAAGRLEALAQRVDWAGADIAEDDAERADEQSAPPRAGDRQRGRRAGAAHAGCGPLSRRPSLSAKRNGGQGGVGDRAAEARKSFPP